MASFTEADRATIRKMFRKTKLAIAPLVKAEAERLNHHKPETLNIMAAQNTMRACMEIVLNECLPYDQRFLAELGVRLAAYAVTAAPIQDHDELVGIVARALPNAVAEKVRQGAVIRSDWEQDGVARPNIPTGAGARKK